MLDFDYFVPTKIFFGRNRIGQIGIEIKKYTQRVLLAYGKVSIKKSGLYDEVIKILKENNLIYKELSGIQPNPRIKSVREGITLCRENKLEFILAVGGGSVIDCAKAIAAGFFYKGDPWDFFAKEIEPTQALPIGTVLTLAAAGSEMNGYSVITNEERREKLAMGSVVLRPKFSILDPTYTFTLPKEQTAAGIVDIYVHGLEQYFSLVPGTFLQDRLAEAIFKTCIYYGPIALREPRNYEARANLMWASSLALNGLLGYGKTGDWSTHIIEHALSAVYDVTHGVGLAIIAPYWMEYVLNKKTQNKFVEYGKNIWGLEGAGVELAKQAIEETGKFFKSLGMPQSLREVGVEKTILPTLASKATIFGDLGEFQKLNKDDVLAILQAAF